MSGQAVTQNERNEYVRIENDSGPDEFIAAAVSRPQSRLESVVLSYSLLAKVRAHLVGMQLRRDGA